MNCLIVDDEILAQEVLAMYISKIDFLQLAGCCDNAIQAFSVLNKQQIDIMFLDIKMPEMSGLDLLKSLKNPPKVILTTAYDEYAVECYELDVVDYLLKPIRFERFMKAAHKVQSIEDRIQGRNNLSLAEEEFYVRSDRKLIRIVPGEILYIEALKNYLSIVTAMGKILVHSTLTNIEEELKSYSYFQRIHKSFIINTRFVSEVDNNLVRLKNKAELPVGGHYREFLLQSLRILNH
jgi:DNA-binding LytR/AlgR family response regulator